MKKLPSIFNDVIGPVMRGPSSSHTAASWRIAKISLELLNEPLKQAVVDFDKEGAWAPNYREQGTVMGIDGGLLGLEIEDSRMKNTDLIKKEQGIIINYEINSFQTKHSNTVRLFLEGVSGKKIKIVAASLGGGTIEIQQIDEFPISIYGDYYEGMAVCNSDRDLEKLKKNLPEYINLNIISGKTDFLINIKSPKIITDNDKKNLKEYLGSDEIIIINPVLPIVGGMEKELPFSNIESLLKYAEENNMDLAQLGILYEQYLSGKTEKKLLQIMKNIVLIIEKSIDTGLRGTKYKNRILPQQSHLINQAAKAKKIPDDTIINHIIENVSALMESKSAMEVIVANPTAGSCGTIGGVIKAVADEQKSTPEEIINAYFAAGLIGAYFALGPGFSAEEHGCQVECGAASGMAAAGIVQLFGGTAKQAVDAASMAIQNLIGMICDPVADRVEIPCLGKNINAAVNALSSATMACSGFDPVIPFEEVIDTVVNVSKQMPTCVKCTGKGGLAITKTSIDIKQKMIDVN